MLDIKEYILLHNDIEVLTFTVDKDECIIQNIVNEKHKPPLLFNYRNDENENLRDWLVSRVVPTTRTKYERLCQNESKFKTIEGRIKLALQNNALTLSDTYWVKEKGLQETWKSINFYENNYNDYLSEYFLNIRSNSPNIVKFDENKKSPSLAASGNLSKSWVIDENDERILLKAGGNNDFGENNIEVIVSNILDDLDINHIKYWKQKFTNHTFSACKCACSVDYEFIPMEEYQYLFNDWSKYDVDYILDKMPWKDEFVKMVFIDFVLCNEDRHWYNFGILRETNTLKEIGLFPIYDNGMCLYCNNEENIGEMITSALIGEVSNELIKILEKPMCKKVIVPLIDKMEQAIIKHIIYSNDLQKHCIKLLNMLK